MEEKNLIIKQARGMIGARLRHNGQNCTVIEVLEEHLEFILEADSAKLAIQADAYGNARREMPTLYYVALFDAAGNAFHPTFLSLEDMIAPKKS